MTVEAAGFLSYSSYIKTLSFTSLNLWSQLKAVGVGRKSILRSIVILSWNNMSRCRKKTVKHLNKTKPLYYHRLLTKTGPHRQITYISIICLYLCICGALCYYFVLLHWDCRSCFRAVRPEMWLPASPFINHHTLGFILHFGTQHFCHWGQSESRILSGHGNGVVKTQDIC